MKFSKCLINSGDILVVPNQARAAESLNMTDPQKLGLPKVSPSTATIQQLKTEILLMPSLGMQPAHLAVGA